MVLRCVGAFPPHRLLKKFICLNYYTYCIVKKYLEKKNIKINQTKIKEIQKMKKVAEKN